MPREIVRPAETIREDIRTLEEITPDGDSHGFVRVMVGVVDADGKFVVPQQYLNYVIKDDMYVELVGPPTSWAPDKPSGTYRNEDLWHFVDLIRAEAQDGQ